MTAKSESAAAPGDREIVSRRIFAAPREKVFAAFADPARLALWWGPNGFTNVIGEFDLRPGGRWELVMRAPGGAEFPADKEFVAVDRPERISFWHLDPVHRFLMTMLFVAEGDATALTWRMRFDSAEEFARVKDFIIPANEENFDRLAAHLSK